MGDRRVKKGGASAASASAVAAAPTSSFARQQLERMGWSEGTGLGKNRTGMTAPIVVQQRQEAAGLGSERDAAQQRLATVQNSEWWKDAVGDTLAKIGKSKTKHKRKRKDVTDADLFAATGGARFGMRAGKTRNQAKWARTEGSNEDAKSEDVVTSENLDSVEPKRKKVKKQKTIDTSDATDVPLQEDGGKKKKKRDATLQSNDGKDKAKSKRNTSKGKRRQLATDL